jgi:adhesin transport system outer membrane protein
VADKTPVAQKETQLPSAEKTAEVIAPTAASDVITRPPALAAAQPAPQIPVPSRPPVPPTAPVAEEKPADTRVQEAIVVPDSRTLAELTGKSEISVLTDVDGQFVKSMAENQILENEFAGQAGDTSLLESIRAGRGFDRESRAASARTEQAKAQTGQAVALLLPSVSVRASYGSETSQPSGKADPITGKAVASYTHPRTDAALTVRQPFFDLPSFMDWRRRKVMEQVRGENYRVSDGDAYISTANAYLSLVSSRLQTDMTREFETRLAELLSYVEKRAGAGAASVSDMARVRARSQATRSSRLEQESAHAAAGIEFVRLTNLVPRKVRLPEPGDLGDSLLPKSFDMAVTTAMKSIPKLQHLRLKYRLRKLTSRPPGGAICHGLMRSIPTATLSMPEGTQALPGREINVS